jgi:hypothetical protein
MRVRSFFSLAAVAAMSAIAIGGVGAGAPSASAATTVQLTVADMYTFDAGSPFLKVICIDDVAMESGAPTVHAPIALAAGLHHLEVFAGTDTNCDQENPNIDDGLNLSGDAQTLLLYWPSGSGPQASLLDDDYACPAAGDGTVVYRPGAAISGDGSTDLGYGTDGVTPFVSDVESGNQGSAAVTAGSYGVWVAAHTGTDAIVVNSQDNRPVVDGTIVIAYTYGGNDGDTGMFFDTLTCTPEIPLTPITPITPITPAALPLAVTPRFTG